MSVVEWIGENIEAKSPRARTPPAVSWGIGSVWRKWWIVPSVLLASWHLKPNGHGNL